MPHTDRRWKKPLTPFMMRPTPDRPAPTERVTAEVAIWDTVLKETGIRL